jgi:hypothetical protein
MENIEGVRDKVSTLTWFLTEPDLAIPQEKTIHVLGRIEIQIPAERVFTRDESQNSRTGHHRESDAPTRCLAAS